MTNSSGHNMKMTNDSCVLEVLDSYREEAAGTNTCEISNSPGTDICYTHVKLGILPLQLGSVAFVWIFNFNQKSERRAHHCGYSCIHWLLEAVHIVTNIQDVCHGLGKSLMLECMLSGSLHDMEERWKAHLVFLLLQCNNYGLVLCFGNPEN